MPCSVSLPSLIGVINRQRCWLPLLNLLWLIPVSLTLAERDLFKLHTISPNLQRVTECLDNTPRSNKLWPINGTTKPLHHGPIIYRQKGPCHFHPKQWSQLKTGQAVKGTGTGLPLPQATYYHLTRSHPRFGTTASKTRDVTTSSKRADMSSQTMTPSKNAKI